MDFPAQDTLDSSPESLSESLSEALSKKGLDFPRGPATGSLAVDPKAALEALEQERLAALQKLAILDTQGEQPYDDLTRLASFICGTSMALISFVDSDRQWFKSKVGFQIDSTPRSESICAYTIQQPGLFIVPDATKDERFSSMPLVAGGVFRFYAGAPISTGDGLRIGSLCVLDDKPRDLSEAQKEALLVLSRSATAYLLIRSQVHQLLRNAEERRTIEQQLRYKNGMLAEANRHLQHLAVTDALTGLPSRRLIESSLHEHQHAAVTMAGSLSLLMIDVDHFKRVNDTYSHETGDLVLKRVAEVLRSSVRDTDTVSRYGGEEFVVLLRGAGHGTAVAQAERLRASIAFDAGSPVQVTVSIGVATARGDHRQQEVPMLLTEADKALYTAKREGRNCVRSAPLPSSRLEESLPC
jgi:diguanylate cyclase (GGDEF)-like protein